MAKKSQQYSLENPSKLALDTIETDSPVCDSLGSINARKGSCHKYLNCSSSWGCS